MVDRTIVCFFADEVYVDMVVPAISTLLRTTPGITVGLLTPTRAIEEEILQHLPPDALGRVIYRPTSNTPHFPLWNPTQYKLDIAKFADYGVFENVFWMDGDTLTFEDMSGTFESFAGSPTTQFLMIPDHVNGDSRFMENWQSQRGEPAPVIPQACFMGFKSGILKAFLAEWKAEWEDWVTPHAFARHPDPRPHYAGSAFCAEQYALGIALQRFREKRGLCSDDAVRWVERRMLEIPRCTRSPSAQPCASPPVDSVESPAAPDPSSASTSTAVETSTVAPSSMSSGALQSWVSSPIFTSANVAAGELSLGLNGVLIDQFPGFYHYYHDNKSSAFQWWKSTHRS